VRRPLGLTEYALRAVVLPQYARVAELQRRGVVHFQAILRLDGPATATRPTRMAHPTRVAQER
jgi:hypothetical protein